MIDIEERDKVTYHDATDITSVKSKLLSDSHGTFKSSLSYSTTAMLAHLIEDKRLPGDHPLTSFAGLDGLAVFDEHSVIWTTTTGVARTGLVAHLDTLT